MKKLALIAVVTIFGYVSAQAQATKTAAGDDNKDGKHTYGVVSTNNGKEKPGVKKVANRSKTGTVKNKKTMVKSGTAVKAIEAKPTGAKPHPTPGFYHGKGHKKGHHKHHGKGKGHEKHGCGYHTTAVSPAQNNTVKAGPIKQVSTVKGNAAAPIVRPSTTVKGGVK